VETALSSLHYPGQDCFTKTSETGTGHLSAGEKVEFREDYFDTMPGVEIDKQIDQLLGKSPGIYSEDVIEWNPPIPEYPFLEQARIADDFFGPGAGSLDGEEHLLDGFRSSPIWRRFVSYANRPVAESRSTGTKWRRPPTLFRIQTSKTIASFATVVSGLPLLFL
jgi:hypothetical protein